MPLQRLRNDTFSHPLKGHGFSRIGAFGSRILRVGAIYVEPPAVGQDFVQLSIVVRPRPFPFPIHLKSARVQERIFILVIPYRMRRRKIGVMSDEVQGIGNGVGRTRIAAGDTKFGLRADDTGQVV